MPNGHREPLFYVGGKVSVFPDMLVGKEPQRGEKHSLVFYFLFQYLSVLFLLEFVIRRMSSNNSVAGK